MSAIPVPFNNLSSRLSVSWIVNRPADLLLFIGSALAGYLYIWLNVGLGIPMIILFWIWSLGFDGPHIFAMASRTYFDREERKKRGKLLFGSLLVFFSLGPTLVLLELQPILLLLVATWAYYHVIRQHYGFMVLYKKKNDDLAKIDNLLDRLFLAVMLIYPPFQRFFIYKVEEMGIPRQYALAQLLPWLDPILRLIIVTIAVAFIVRQLQRMRDGKALNIPKYLLMLAVIPLHWLTFHYMGPLDSVPTVTIFHNIQYHGIIWFYNRNRYQPRQEAARRYGWLPAWVTHRFAYYVIAALLFSALYRIPGYWLGHYHPHELTRELAFGFFWGFGFTHYFLDSRIWRVRH
ncbi:MAG: hypothetical protein AB1489_23260, partial [Acidobacteriota bacterium]